MGQISKNRKKLQKNSKFHKKWTNFENSSKNKKKYQILSIFSISMDFLSCMINKNIDQFMAF